MATPPVLTPFPWFCRHFLPQRGVHTIVNMGGVVKTLRRSNSLSRSVFSTVGSFGYISCSAYVSYAYSPPERNSGEIFGKLFKETDEKRGEILAKFSGDFRASISREIGHKKIHTNSSTHQDLKFHTAEPKFFHGDTLGVGGPNVSVGFMYVF